MLGFFKNELIEVIEWKEDNDDLVIWKFPDKDSNIKYGAQLTVRESQMALFFNEGQIADVFLPGRHTLHTENMPILTTLKSWKYGFNSPFKCDVYFVNSKQLRGFKWGTPNPVFFKDPEAGNIQIRAFGVYMLRIVDPKLFFREYAGTKEALYTSELEDTLRDLIAPKFAAALLKVDVSAFQLYSSASSLGQIIKPLLQEDLTPFGLELTKFEVSSVSLPPEVEEHMKEMNKMGLTSDQNLNKMERFAQMDALKESSKHGMNPQQFQNNQQQMFMQQMMMNQMMQNMMGNQNPMQNQQQNLQNSTPEPKLSREEIMKNLKELGELKEMGILTQEEFDKKKTELLAQL